MRPGSDQAGSPLGRGLLSCEDLEALEVTLRVVMQMVAARIQSPCILISFPNTWLQATSNDQLCSPSRSEDTLTLLTSAIV